MTVDRGFIKAPTDARTPGIMSTVDFRPRFTNHYYTQEQLGNLSFLKSWLESTRKDPKSQALEIREAIVFERERIEEEQFVALCKAFLLWAMDRGYANGQWCVLGVADEFMRVLMRLSKFRRGQRSTYDVEGERAEETLEVLRRRMVRKYRLADDDAHLIDHDLFRELSHGLLVRQNAAFELRLRTSCTVWTIPMIPPEWRNEADIFERMEARGD